MKVRVDRERCQGHARCAALADKAYLAQANCPEFAIEVNDA